MWQGRQGTQAAAKTALHMPSREHFFVSHVSLLSLRALDLRPQPPEGGATSVQEVPA
jgi:hypothetical protein